MAGLNQITVLLDRSETDLTEIGHNEWPSGMDGPPHKHDDKDQIFYITSGIGEIKLGDQLHSVQKGCMLYVPEGIVHQTNVGADGPLCYLLLNVFRDSEKEGHGTFEEHIEKVKLIRKKQAETQHAGEGLTSTNVKEPKFFKNIHTSIKSGLGTDESVMLLSRSETIRSEVSLITWTAQSEKTIRGHEDRELSFFILAGQGSIISIENQSQNLGPGDLLYVPRNTPYTIQIGRHGLKSLCLASLVTKS